MPAEISDMLDQHANNVYRSGLEVSIAKQLQAANVTFQYEAVKIPFLYPERTARYLPDFILGNGIVIEAKGQFTTQDRKKMKLVKKAHPELDIRFVFNNPRALISKTSKTSYGKWCDEHGFPYAKGLVPQAWIEEPPNAESAAVLCKLFHDVWMAEAEERKRQAKRQPTENQDETTGDIEP